MSSSGLSVAETTGIYNDNDDDNDNSSNNSNNDTTETWTRRRGLSSGGITCLSLLCAFLERLTSIDKLDVFTIEGTPLL